MDAPSHLELHREPRRAARRDAALPGRLSDRRHQPLARQDPRPRARQATDRVHRIGQRRAVQVFRLITEGTLEEKISSIIERKRRLMDSVVAHDDPSLAKIFTRSELLELLRGG
jgi:hypothetical protein